MDDGLLRRLSNISKNYYTLSTIDDLFIYAGANPQWKVDDARTSEQAYSPCSSASQRVRRFYGWTEGIKIHSPQLINLIISKVIKQIILDTEVPEIERNILSSEIMSLDTDVKSPGIELEPLLSTLSRSLASDGCAKEVAVLTSAEARLDWVNHDSFTGIDSANIVLTIPYKLYEQIKLEKEHCERLFSSMSGR